MIKESCEAQQIGAHHATSGGSSKGGNRSKCSEEQEQEQLSAVDEAAQNMLPNPARSPSCNHILNSFVL